MIKAELVKAVAQRANILNVKIARQAVDAVFDIIAIKLETNEQVTISGFGTFTPVHRRGRKGRTGTMIQFRPHKNLQKSISKSISKGGKNHELQRTR